MQPSFQDCQKKAAMGDDILSVYEGMSSDLLTPVALFYQLRTSNRPCFLLESADGGEQVGRYSFLGINPIGFLTLKDGELVIEEEGEKRRERPKDPMGEIGRYLNRFKGQSIPGIPPLQGGAIGYVSYDSVSYLERVPTLGGGPDCYDVYLLFFRDIVAFDRLNHHLYLITHLRPIRGLKKEYAKAEKRLQQLKSDIFSAHLPEKGLPMPQKIAHTLKVKENLGAERYMASVRKIKNYIRAGDIFQCVLSDQFTFPFEQDHFLLYRILRMINPSPYLFYLDFGDETLIGSSPEMLTKVEKGIISTCPIAGTRPRGDHEKADKKFEKELLKSVKEQAEHLMLVDLGRNDVGRVSRAGSVRVTDFMKIERFSHVMHLVSLVEGRLAKGLSAWDAFCSCFPAGTLSGAPKIRAMEIIAELEGTRRGTYGGAVVAHDYFGNLNSCITIRSMWVKNGRGYIQSGAGVVADSSPKKEYEEVQNKAMAIKKAASLANMMGEV